MNNSAGDRRLRVSLRRLVRAYNAALDLAVEHPDLVGMGAAMARLAAAAVEPPRVLVRDQRRRGMNAMAAALAWSAGEEGGSVPPRPRRHYAALYGVTPFAVGEARSVIRHAPDLAPEVLAGKVMLLDAYLDGYWRQQGEPPRSSWRLRRREEL